MIVPRAQRSWMLRGSAIGLMALILAGCASSAPATTAIKEEVQADQSINPNQAGDPFPVVLRIYELKQPTAFNQASFFDLLDNDTAKLGTDLVAKQEVELKPGDSPTFDRNSPLDTQYIGVIAGFRDMDHSQWRQIVQITPGKTNHVVIKLTALSVSIQNTVVSSWGTF